MTHASPPAKRKAKPKKVAHVAPAPDPEESAALAKLALSPSTNAAAVVSAYGATAGVSDKDLRALIECMAEDVKAVWAGDLSQAEGMLYVQAQALQTIFMNLTRRAVGQEYLKQWECFLRMALKAQNQCRMTLETLATIKNPPVVIARQANINHGGQQQVNNSTAPAKPSPTHAEQSATAPNKLLEQSHGQWLDTGAAGAASRVDPQLEAVGAINRAA